jgi:hypothetical protein
MTDLAGSTGHGSTAHRGPAGQPAAAVPDRPEPPPQQFLPPTPRLAESDPVPVGLGEILAVDADAPPGPAPASSPTAAPARRADLVAGPLLLLAGVAAGASLLVVWTHGGPPGLDLVGAALRDVRRDAASWPPLAVVGGGGVLFVLGLLMYVPARTHRFLGALALLACLLVAAGVLVPLADAGWDVAHWAVGAWCAAAAGGLGLVGALTALNRRR